MEEQEKLGIESLKETLVYGGNLAETLVDVLADKKIKVDEWGAILQRLMQLPGLIGSFKASVAEFKDLDQEEAVELVNYFANTFDIPDDKAEAHVEAVFNWLIASNQLLAAFK